MKMDINGKGQRRHRSRLLVKRHYRRLVWEGIRWALILGPRLAQLIEWLRS